MVRVSRPETVMVVELARIFSGVSNPDERSGRACLKLQEKTQVF